MIVGHFYTVLLLILSVFPCWLRPGQYNNVPRLIRRQMILLPGYSIFNSLYQIHLQGIKVFVIILGLDICFDEDNYYRHVSLKIRNCKYHRVARDKREQKASYNHHQRLKQLHFHKHFKIKHFSPAKPCVRQQQA